MTLKIPTNFRGINGKEAYEKIMNEKESEKGTFTSPPVNPTLLGDYEKYEYFFAGENEYNLYKEFVEKNFYKKQKKGINTFEELAKPILENKIFKGSSSYINPAMNMALKEAGLDINVVTQAQLEYIFQNSLLNLSNIYSDTGMCLRTENGNNESHAKSLINQLTNQNLPAYIPVISYDLEKKGDSLGFKIIDKNNIINVPILNSSNQSKFSNSDIDLNLGFPKQLNEKGDRTFWTTDSGLSSCCLSVGSDLDTGSSNLSGSYDYGRVVLAKVRST